MAFGLSNREMGVKFFFTFLSFLDDSSNLPLKIDPPKYPKTNLRPTHFSKELRENQEKNEIGFNHTDSSRIHHYANFEWLSIFINSNTV